MVLRCFKLILLVIFLVVNPWIVKASEDAETAQGLHLTRELARAFREQLRKGFMWSSPFIYMINEENSPVWAFGMVPNAWIVIDPREDTRYGRINVWEMTSGCYNDVPFDLYAFVVTPSGRVISFDGKEYPRLVNIEPVSRGSESSYLCMENISVPALPFYEGDGRYFVFVGARNPGDPFDIDGWMSISINWIPIVLGVDDEVQALIEQVSSLSDVRNILSQIERGQEYQYYIENRHENFLGLWVYNYFPKVVWRNKSTSCGGFAALGYELIKNGLGYEALYVSVGTVPEAYSHAFLVFKTPDGKYGYQSNDKIVTGYSHWYDAVQTVIDTEILPSAPGIQVPFIRVGEGWKPFFSEKVRHKENYRDMVTLEDFFDVYRCNSQELQEKIREFPFLQGIDIVLEGILVLTPEQARDLSFDEILSMLEQDRLCLED